MKTCSDESLFDSNRLQLLVRNKQIYQYFLAILISCQQFALSSNNISSNRRFQCFLKSISIMFRDNTLDNPLFSELKDKLLVNVRYLDEYQAFECVLALIMNLRNVFNNKFNVSNIHISKILELFYPLVEKCNIDQKLPIIMNVIELKWSKSLFAIILSMLCEIVLTESESEIVLQKLTIFKEFQAIYLDSNETTAGVPLHYRIDSFNLEDLPSILHQVISLINKCENNSALLRTKFLYVISNAMDHLLVNCTMIRHSSQGSEMTDQYTRNPIQQEYYIILATAVQEISITMIKGHLIATTAADLIKSHRIYTYIEGKQFISPSLLLLCFMASKGSQIETKILNNILDVFNEILSTQLKSESSIWYSMKFTNKLNQFSINCWRNALKFIFFNGFVLDMIGQPLRLLGLSLLDSTHSKTGTHISERITSTSLHPCSTESLRISSHCDDFRYVELGSWILIELFNKCEHARLPILRDILSRLTPVVQFESVSRSSNTARVENSTESDTLTVCCVDVLHELCHTSPHALIAYVDDLAQSFLIIRDSLPKIACGILQSFAPLFRLSNALTDRCAMTLRKASFSTSIRSRQSAIASLCSLLSLQMSNELPSHMGSGLSSDELLSLLKRFFQHQVSVRSYLYQNLYQIQSSYPTLRGTVLRLLTIQLRAYLEDSEDPSESVDDKLDSNISRDDKVLSISSLLSIGDNKQTVVDSMHDLMTTVCWTAALAHQRRQLPFNSSKSLTSSSQENKSHKQSMDIDIDEENLFSQVEYMPMTQFPPQNVSLVNTNKENSNTRDFITGSVNDDDDAHDNDHDDSDREEMITLDQESITFDSNPEAVEAFQLIFSYIQSFSRNTIISYGFPMENRYNINVTELNYSHIIKLRVLFETGYSCLLCLHSCRLLQCDNIKLSLKSHETLAESTFKKLHEISELLNARFEYCKKIHVKKSSSKKTVSKRIKGIDRDDDMEDDDSQMDYNDNSSAQKTVNSVDIEDKVSESSLMLTFMDFLKNKSLEFLFHELLMFINFLQYLNPNIEPFSGTVSAFLMPSSETNKKLNSSVLSTFLTDRLFSQGLVIGRVLKIIEELIAIFENINAVSKDSRSQVSNFDNIDSNKMKLIAFIGKLKPVVCHLFRLLTSEFYRLHQAHQSNESHLATTDNKDSVKAFKKSIVYPSYVNCLLLNVPVNFSLMNMTTRSLIGCIRLVELTTSYPFSTVSLNGLKVSGNCVSVDVGSSSEVQQIDRSINLQRLVKLTQRRQLRDEIATLLSRTSALSNITRNRSRQVTAIAETNPRGM